MYEPYSECLCKATEATIWSSSIYQAHSWNRVVEEFAEFTSVNLDYEPIHEFALQVASKYGNVLFPIKSMLTLIISPNQTYEWGHDVLYVAFKDSEQQFDLECSEKSRHLPLSDRRRNWRKECGASEGFRTFERFFALKKWIVVLPPEREPHIP